MPTRKSFRVAADLVAQGVSPWDIASGLYENQEAVRLRLLGRVLDTLTISADGRLASVAVSTEMLREAGAGPEHTDSFVNYPRAIRGVEVALFFRQIRPGCLQGRVSAPRERSTSAPWPGPWAAAVITMPPVRSVEGRLEEVQSAVLARLAGLLK